MDSLGTAGSFVHYSGVGVGGSQVSSFESRISNLNYHFRITSPVLILFCDYCYAVSMWLLYKVQEFIFALFG